MDKNFFKELTIKTYLLGAFILISVVPIITLGVIEYTFIFNNTISMVKKNNALLLDNIKDKIDYHINLNIRTTDIFSKSIDEFDSIENVRVKLVNLFKENKNINLIEYVTAQEDIVISSNMQSFKKYQGFEKEIKNKMLSKGGLIVKPIPEKEMLMVINPFFDGNIITSYLLIIFDLKDLMDYLQKIIDEKEKLYVYDYSEKKLIFSSEKTDSALSKLVNFFANRNRLEESVIKAEIDSIKWAIFLEHSMSVYEEEKLKHNLVNAFIASLISLFLAAGMGLWISYSQYKFVITLLESIYEIAKGNYKKKVNIDLVLIPKEFVMVIEEFNSMVEKISILDAFKSNLIDTVSHEFRTPLTSIKGFTSTMLRPDAKFDEQTKRKLLKIISDQSDRLSRMVEDLLVVPKLEGNILKLNIEPLNLEQTVSNISEFFPNNKFDIEIPENIYILVDADRFEQILLNLFENAKKYALVKTDPIKVLAQEKNNFIELDIKNTSQKIPEDELQELFNKFVRLDNKLTRTTGGTGLGLYITKGLIELMNGKIWLESSEEFFTVKIQLPKQSV